ncbi:MAG: molybdate ABC transporter substrate-binding protein [Sulfurimonas sp.]|jgi:molybdate transport system substrate-binding protein
MLKKLLICTLFFSVSLFAAEIKVAVSANASYAVEAAVMEFKKQYRDIKVTVTHASNKELKSLVTGRVDYELLISDDRNFLESLHKNEKSSAEPMVYAVDELVLFSAKEPDYNKGLKLLKDKDITKVLVLDLNTTFYGNSAIEAMQKEKVYEQARQKISFVDSFSDSLLSDLGENEMAIVQKSLLHTAGMKKFKKDKNWIELCSKLYTPINLNILMLKNGENNRDAKLLYDYILSEDAKQIFKNFGYSTEW